MFQPLAKEMARGVRPVRPARADRCALVGPEMLPYLAIVGGRGERPHPGLALGAGHRWIGEEKVIAAIGKRVEDIAPTRNTASGRPGITARSPPRASRATTWSQPKCRSSGEPGVPRRRVTYERLAAALAHPVGGKSW